MKLFGILIASLALFACTRVDDEASVESASAATSTSTSTDTSTDINWMWVGHCDPDLSDYCNVVCANDHGIVVLAGTCDASTSCRVPDQDGVCQVMQCVVMDTNGSCSTPYRRIRDGSGISFCCKDYGA